MKKMLFSQFSQPPPKQRKQAGFTHHLSYDCQEVDVLWLDLDCPEAWMVVQQWQHTGGQRDGQTVWQRVCRRMVERDCRTEHDCSSGRACNAAICLGISLWFQNRAHPLHQKRDFVWGYPQRSPHQGPHTKVPKPPHKVPKVQKGHLLEVVEAGGGVRLLSVGSSSCKKIYV